MAVLTVKNQMFKPQDSLPSMLVYGVQDDGQTINQFNIRDYAKGAYLLLFFFPLGLKEDSEEVLKFAKSLKELKELDCKVIGVTSESPLAIKRWIVKDHESGGFGQVLGFPMISDKDLALAMSMGVARGCGVPSRSAFLFDPRGLARYCAAHKSGIKFNTKELLRLVNAVKTSDRTGMAVPAGWKSGEDDLIPTEYSAKVAYFKRKYGSNVNVNVSASLKKLFTDFDRDGDGLITLEEIKMTMLDFGKDVPQTELSLIFEDKAFDKDKDGLVTLDEIRAHLLEIGKGISENELKDLFNKADKNSDGKIDVTEFKELVELLPGKESEGKINPNLLKVFEQFDSDHDGLISKQEVRSILRAIGKHTSDTELDTCFNESDTNKDGKIDITEFSSFIAKLKQGGKLKDRFVERYVLRN